jgi:hypothetical protein
MVIVLDAVTQAFVTMPVPVLFPSVSPFEMILIQSPRELSLE